MDFYQEGNNNMEEKLALVGGSSAGMGKAIADGLLAKGMDVILTARGEERLKQTHDELKKKHPSRKIFSLPSDFSSRESVETLINTVIQKAGAPDVLVLNTGGPKLGPVLSLAVQDWDDAYQQQFRSFLMLVKAFVPEMQKKKWGRILNVNSLITLEPSPALSLSAGYRAMVINMLKCLSIETAKDNITVNVACPGKILTERLVTLHRMKAGDMEKPLEDVVKELSADIPAGRVGTPEEFASLVCFLAGDEARYITGCVIPVDGSLRKGSL